MSEDKDMREQEAEAAVTATAVVAENEAPAGGARPAPAMRFPEVKNGAGGSESPLERLYDLTVPVTVELGKALLTVQQILQLAPGSVVELDHSAEAPVEMYVHGKCVGRGEIVVVDEFYGLRITSVG